MKSQIDQTTPAFEEVNEISRRQAVKIGGGGLAALTAAWLVGKSATAGAQDATPMATPADCIATTPAENKAIVESYFTAWASGDTTSLAALLSPSYIHHWGIDADATGADAMLASFTEFSAAFPDIQITLMALVAENDLVVAYWQMTGTQVAEFRGTPPVDVEVTYAGFNLFRIECGLVAESWNESDHLGRLIQQGTITQDELESVGTPTP